MQRRTSISLSLSLSLSLSTPSRVAGVARHGHRAASISPARTARHCATADTITARTDARHFRRALSLSLPSPLLSSPLLSSLPCAHCCAYFTIYYYSVVLHTVLLPLETDGQGIHSYKQRTVCSGGSKTSIFGGSHFVSFIRNTLRLSLHICPSNSNCPTKRGRFRLNRGK